MNYLQNYQMGIYQSPFNHQVTANCYGCQNQYRQSFGNSSFTNFNTTNKTNPLQSDTLQTQQQSQIAPQNNKSKKGISTTAILGIGLGVLATAVIAIAATRGKKIKLSPTQENKLNELIAAGKLNSENAEIFKSIEHLNGEQFIKKCYQKLTKSMGYSNLSAPDLVIISAGKAGCSSANSGKITINTLGFNTKEKQIGAIRHELEHFRQKEMCYRAFGKEAYINAKIDAVVNKYMLCEDICIKKFSKKFSELSEKEIEQLRNGLKNDMASSLGIAKLELVLSSKGKIPVGSEEYKEAETYLNAAKNYVTPTMVGEHLTKENLNKWKVENPKLYNLIIRLHRQYNASPLEKGAVKEENIMKD